MTASAIGYLPANRSVTVLDNQDVPADFAFAESTVTTYHVSNVWTSPSIRKVAGIPLKLL